MALAQDPVWRAAATRPDLVGTPVETVWLADLRNGFPATDGVALLLVLLARAIRALRDRRAGRVNILYPDGRRAVVPLGFSLLEASRVAGIDHASPCGGRGRCSLCRVRVAARMPLPAVTRSERRILDQLGLDPDIVRLACLLRPEDDIAVIPLIPPEAATALLHRRQSGVAPEERFLVHLFVDMRDSTRFAATRLPHDSVFILGRFIACVSAAVLEAGGREDSAPARLFFSVERDVVRLVPLGDVAFSP